MKYLVLVLFLVGCTEIKYIVIREVPKAQCPQITKEFFVERFNEDDSLEQILNKEAENLKRVGIKIEELEKRLICVEEFYKQFHKKETKGGN